MSFAYYHFPLFLYRSCLCNVLCECSQFFCLFSFFIASSVIIFLLILFAFSSLMSSTTCYISFDCQPLVFPLFFSPSSVINPIKQVICLFLLALYSLISCHYYHLSHELMFAPPPTLLPWGRPKWGSTIPWPRFCGTCEELKPSSRLRGAKALRLLWAACNVCACVCWQETCTWCVCIW